MTNSAKTVTLSTSCLNQWAMDFDGNSERIIRSIEKARAEGSTYRLGPELETTGYGCEDHFLEPDTLTHSWEVIAKILSSNVTMGILVDIGAPVSHRSTLYNCRIILLNREIVLIRPKCILADDGNYRESRWFRAWNFHSSLQTCIIPPFVRATTVSGARECPFGARVALIDPNGVSISFEICEELWAPQACHVDLYLGGVDIIGNGSASHHELRKLRTRIDLVRNASRSSGGVYLYSNQRGCDSGRLYYDGAPLVASNGFILGHGRQFALDTEVEVLTVTLDLGEIHSYRSGLAARGVQATQLSTSSQSAETKGIERIFLPDSFCFASLGNAPRLVTTLAPVKNFTLSAPEEIAYGPACWLWDYLRRSRMRGFFLPLSGGADSCSTAVIVGSMCQLLVEAANKANCETRLLDEIRHVAGTGENEEYIPRSAHELANKILCTMYMGSERASSKETRDRAHRVAEEIGAWHCAIEIDAIVGSFLNVVRCVFGSGKVPRFRADGGSNVENLALQNIQARVRMVLSYLFAQLANWARGRDGALLVLGSANVDESLRGYLTKYDCSAADINPIGGISKQDLRLFLEWTARDDGLGYKSVVDIVRAKPSAELEPIVNGREQTDEGDMGMSYEELSVYGRLRKIGRCGPVSMFYRVVAQWGDRLSLREIGDKVKHFWRMYAINRHKLTTLTPSYHAENYSPEDNRFDLRQFLYRVSWPWQFERIDQLVKEGIEEEDVSTNE